MKFYFIRHAPTLANMAGAMVKNYQSTDICLTHKPDDWEQYVGCYIPKEDRNYIISSPTKRCVNTAKLLFNKVPDEISKYLAEFECEGLGDKKFWEITKEEFEELVPLTSKEMEIQIDHIFEELANTIKHEENVDAVIAVTHGMLIRYIYHYMTNHKDISAYEVINSVGFKFANLDLLIVDTDNKTVMAHHYSEPINHK